MSEDTVKGFSLSGEEIEGMSDKKFSIHAKPFYKNFPNPSEDDKNRVREGLVIPVIVNGVETEWNANKTSQKTIINKCGRELIKWIGFEGEFEVKSEKVAGADRKVIYIK